MSQKHRSQEWKDRKTEFFIRHKKSCAICGINYDITLHHLRYNHPIGKEPDTDLMPVCFAHHKEIHEYADLVGGHYDLAEATMIFCRIKGLGGNPLRKPRKRSHQKKLRKKKSRKPRQYTTKSKYANNTLKARENSSRTARKRTMAKR
jgi:hypothetical protein